MDEAEQASMVGMRVACVAETGVKRPEMKRSDIRSTQWRSESNERVTKLASQPVKRVSGEASHRRKSRHNGRLFSFFYSKFRISGWWNKTAKFLWVNWCVSDLFCWVVTLVGKYPLT